MGLSYRLQLHTIPYISHNAIFTGTLTTILRVPVNAALWDTLYRTLFGISWLFRQQRTIYHEAVSGMCDGCRTRRAGSNEVTHRMW